MTSPAYASARLARIAACLTGALLLAGCGSADTDPGPGGVSVGEARELDEAAEIVEQRRAAPQSPAGADGGDAQPADSGS